ncbi:hypothetical protein KR018_007164 [Drosophila ironensis]|nr:hypothetical protein KR018_007164 [Drosophila ironensis]
MQRLKDLYKEQSLALSPRNHSVANRGIQRAARAKQREDVFQSNRVISVSPTPVKVKPGPESAPQPGPQEPPLGSKENQAPEANKPTNRRQQFLDRFMQWKAVKKEQRRRYEVIRRGFHQEKPWQQQTVAFPGSTTFTEPENIKTPPAEAPVFVPPKRASLYVIVNKAAQGQGQATGPQAGPKVAPKLLPTLAKPPPKTPTWRQPSSKPVERPIRPPSKTPIVAAKPAPMARQTASQLKPRMPNLQAVRTTIPKPLPAKPKAPPSEKKVPMFATPKYPNVASRVFQKPATTLFPIPVTTVNKIAEARLASVRTQSQGVPRAGGAAGKFKSAPPAAPKNRALNKSTRMKPTVEKKSFQKLESKARLMRGLRNELIVAATVEQLPITPLEEDQAENPFLAQATSTQLKSSHGDSLKEAFAGIEGVSPLSSEEPEQASHIRQPASKKKFDFTRYSVVKAAQEVSPVLDSLQKNDATEATLIAEADAATKTPPRRDSMPNYMSPFVSVSRGKVNSRCEREKRNSMYLCDETAPVEVRRALESVCYFRLQLDNEIKRLHDLCFEWEAYRDQNEARLEETGGVDLINMTVRQTRLLTSSKFMQFRQLIDSCEARALGKQEPDADGSEKSKPVEVADLEGWWDMVRLQSIDVDNRFHRMDRWRANNWEDPDSVPQEVAVPKPKPKITRNMKIKSKAKASSSLQQFLRKAHAEMKKANPEPTPVEDSIAAPSTPKRRNSRIIVVRDRKSYSPARTVLRMSTDKARPSISASNGLLKSALIAAAEQNAVKTPPRTRASILKTPGTAKRQNRGVMFSAKKKVRRFEFTYDEANISDVGGDKVEDCEEDMWQEERAAVAAKAKAKAAAAAAAVPTADQEPGVAPLRDENGETPRSYTLRNRKVKLRPSEEFMF